MNWLETMVDQSNLSIGEQRRLQKAIAQRVYELENNRDNHQVVFRAIYSAIKSRYGIESYKYVKRQDLQKAIRYISSWIPK